MIIKICWFWQRFDNIGGVNFQAIVFKYSFIIFAFGNVRALSKFSFYADFQYIYICPYELVLLQGQSKGQIFTQLYLNILWFDSQTETYKKLPFPHSNSVETDHLLCWSSITKYLPFWFTFDSTFSAQIKLRNIS